MKSKFILASILIAGASLFFTHSASAYIDSLGRVFPGKKPKTHKIVVHKVVKKTVKKSKTK